MHTKHILALGVATTVLSVGAVVAVEVATADPAHAQGWLYYDFNGDGCADAWTIDANDNGVPETTWFDLTHDCRWDTWAAEDDEVNGIVDRYGYDLNQNGNSEVFVTQQLTRLGPQIDVCQDPGDDGWGVGSNDICLGSVIATVGSPDWGAGPYGLFVAMANAYGTVV